MRSTALTATLLLVSTACAPSDSAPDPDVSTEATATAAGPTSPEAAVRAALQVATERSVRNAHAPIPGVLTAAQPTTEQFEALADAGIRSFISLRPTSEDGAGWEEAHDLDEGVRFTRLPISGAESLTRENVEVFAALLEAADDEATAVYCASSNRVGAMFALKAWWLDGAEAEEAFALGEAAGMRSLSAPVRKMMGLPPAG